MRFVRLPDRLRDALAREALNLPLEALAAAARSLSEGYRASRPVRLNSEADLSAYALTRLPATFAAVHTCLSELPFRPDSLLDLGAGPGAALWACETVWGALGRATCLDLNPGWAPMAARLGAPEARWRTLDLRAAAHLEQHDLVVCSYVLNELHPLEGMRVLEEAWRAAGCGLLVIEPGTPQGFRRMREARQWLIEAGAFLAAPCPHNNPCPITGDDWCHFAVRVERTRLHRQAKGGELGYEDEKYSYVLAVRRPAGERAPRILRRPRVDPGLIQIRLCGPGGLSVLRVTKREKTVWRAARKASWGDAWQSENWHGESGERPAD